MIIHDGITVPRLEYAQDPDEAVEYTFQMRPDVWQSATVYYDKLSIVIPSVFNGYYYIAVSGGVSEATEPSWPCKKGQAVQDGCVTWKAAPYDLFLRPGKNINTATWSVDAAGVTISNAVNTTDKATALISTIPDAVSEIRVTIRFTFNNAETADRSFIVPVKEL